MAHSRIQKEYFEWMYDLVCDDRFADDISYRKLLTRLHEREFEYIIPKDSNRAEDGIDLRYRADCYYPGPCSVLEMMVALAIRCEETIMDDPVIGDRTGQWFWKMINNLGLGGMYDSRYDIDKVDRIIDRFLDREYSPDGRGGLFTVRNCEEDMRDVEIWTQLCYFLDSIT